MAVIKIKKFDPIPKRKYVAGRYDDATKGTVDEPTDEEQGRRLKENPEKTKRRMRAQTLQNETYDWNDKKEYAGRYVDEPEEYKPSDIKLPEPEKSPELPYKPMHTAKETNITQRGKKYPAQKPPTVKWLRGKDRGTGLQRRKRVVGAQGSSRPAAY